MTFDALVFEALECACVKVNMTRIEAFGSLSVEGNGAMALCMKGVVKIMKVRK